MSPFGPYTTQFTSRTGMSHYSPYNLRSRGSRQTFECLPTPSGSPTRPRSSSTDGDAGGLRTPAGESMYDAARQALLAGVPVVTLPESNFSQDALCHLVLLQFVRDCADMAEAVYDEQQRVLVALENGVSISDNESKLFHPVQMQHVKELMEIADGVTNNLEGRLARNCAETTQAMFGEQRRIILAYTAGQSVSEDELKIFHPIEVGYIGTLVKIANTINDDLEHNILGYGQLVELIIGLALGMAVDNIIEADFHTDVRILPHKVTDVALMQLPDSPMETQPTFRKRFLPLHHVDSEDNLPRAQRVSHTSPNGTGTSTTMGTESCQSQLQTTSGTSLDVPGVASSQPVEMGDLFVHRLNGSVSFWVCTCTQPLTWEPIAIGDAWLLDRTRFLALQDEQPTWVLLETLERYKRHQRRSKGANVDVSERT
ncbi:hypothetical protein EDD15DRAFT_2192532 [Pisolithus albus]|nr:hypothetical protein EDD15DRAFT_2192532 [Pisolithus albus]